MTAPRFAKVSDVVHVVMPSTTPGKWRSLCWAIWSRHTPTLVDDPDGHRLCRKPACKRAFVALTEGGDHG